MATPISARAVAEQHDLADWRFLLDRIHATFFADSYEHAVELIARISDAATVAEHHPDIDLRYPGRIHVALTTHAAGAVVTDADLSLAATISRLAASAGARPDVHASQSVEIAVDAMDIDAVRPFWRAVLAYVDEKPSESGQILAVIDPARIGPTVWFQQMDEPRPQRNRIHVDVTVPHDVAEERLASALAAGGRLVSDAAAKSFWVLADPEGNEVCICTWQDRD